VLDGSDGDSLALGAFEDSRAIVTFGEFGVLPLPTAI
jgi:hypothetical protein